ncbi:cytochrome P450 1A1-like isoform X2 [Ptychodera flava]|uniref:cytochrome P450 1A1-like isoform X2 n=1 Tax=Ptychodera flava TaxID=63121 RepID=UPI00396A8A61
MSVISYLTKGTFSAFPGIALIVIAVIVFSALWGLRRPRGWPNGPVGLPFIGSAFELVRNPHLTMAKYAKKYGPIYSMKIGTRRVVVLNTMDMVKEALVDKANDFAGRMQTQSFDIISEGRNDIVFGEFSKFWQFRRKLGAKTIRKYASGPELERLFQKEALPRLLKAIEEKNEEPFQLKTLIMLTIVNIVGAMCFGKQYDLEDQEFQEIVKVTKNTLDNFGNGLMGDVMPILRHVPTPSVVMARRGVLKWLGIIQKHVDDHMDKFQNDNTNTQDLIDELLKSRTDEATISSGKAYRLDSTNLRQITSNLFGEKVRREVDEVIGQDRLPALTDRKNMPYCNAVINETLRIRSIAIIIPRCTTCDTAVGGFLLKKGTWVFCNTWKIHMDETVWSKPEEFRPERFLDKHGQLLHKPDNFIPFGMGRRMCLGETLAMNEMFLYLVSLIQRYSFSTPPDGTKPRMQELCEAFIIQCRPYKIVARRRRPLPNNESH